MDIPDEVKKLARSGTDKKIHAIQALRKATGMGLAEAKVIVETIAAGGEVQLPPDPPRPAGETREQRLHRQLATLCETGCAATLNKEEIAQLLGTLDADEDLVDLAQAGYDYCGGVLVATQRRLLFMNDKADGRVVEEFPFDSIHLWRRITGPEGFSVKLFMSDYRRAEFTDMSSEAARSLIEVLQRYASESLDCGKIDASDEIEQLEALYDNGVISKDELEDGKRKILGRLRRHERRHRRVDRRPS